MNTETLDLFAAPAATRQSGPPPLRDYQTAAVERVREELRTNRGTLVLLATGCHAPGQSILMADGSRKAVEYVRVGDEIMGPDSRPRGVTALLSGAAPLVDIVPVKGEAWTVNLDHILTLERTQISTPPRYPSHRGGGLVDVSVREYLTWSKTKRHLFKLPRRGADFARSAAPPIDPYFVGVFLGDGSLSNGCPNVTSVDAEIIEACSAVAGSYGLRLRKHVSADRAPQWYIVTEMSGGTTPNRLTTELRSLGLAAGCAEKRVPESYLVADRGSRLAVLAGLIDTDGSLTDGCFDYVSKSSGLANDVAYLARSLGLAAYIKPCRKSCQTGAVGDYWRVCISGGTDEIPTRIPRKRAAPRGQKKDVLRVGFDVRPAVARGEFFGFSLEGDGRFLLGDFTVTHNTGKTQIASELIRHWPGRTCFIAHRTELIAQAARRIAQFTGRQPEIEKADDRADPSSDEHVVASIQTLARESRIQRFARDAFSLIVVDEVHHATSGTYRAVLDYFADAKVVGLTATPDRLDGEALGSVLDSVAYRFELGEAISAGWLAPVKMRVVKVDGIDFSQVRTVAGEFHQGDLDALMAREEALHGVARPAVELAENRPTIVFTTSIDNARRMAEIIDRYAGRRAAVAVDSKLNDVERATAFRLFESGERQFLVNVGVTTEGYDHPPTACVVLGRPTKSRALVVQMVGRGTRGGSKCPIPGKTDCRVIDFVGANEQHDVMSAADALAGDISDEEARLIKAEIQKAKEPLSLDEARQLAEESKRKLEAEAEAHAARRAHIKAHVAYREFDPNPYVALGVRRDYLHERYGYAAATDAQLSMIRNALGKHADSLPKALGKLEASRLISQIVKRRDQGLCTLRQMYALKRQGVDADRFSFRAASSVMDALAKNNWRPLAADRVQQIVRDAG